jgi:Zn-dependent alcohol dehydrogenase
MTDGTLLDGTMRFRSGASEVGQAGYLGTFAYATVVPANCVVPIDKEIPFEEGALIGCGVLTGFGAAANTAQLGPGDHVVIAGCGGVGLNAIQGARIAGAEVIIAVDRVSEKLEMAQLLGATHVVDTTEVDLPAAVREITDGRGADVGMEVTGVPAVLANITAATRRGGTIVIVGQQPMDSAFPIPTGMMNMLGQRILPSIYGGSDVHRDIPRLIGLLQSGELHLEQMVSRRIKLHEVNEALISLDDGSPDVRTVIDLTA